MTCHSIHPSIHPCGPTLQGEVRSSWCCWDCLEEARGTAGSPLAPPRLPPPILRRVNQLCYRSRQQRFLQRHGVVLAAGIRGPCQNVLTQAGQATLTTLKYSHRTLVQLRLRITEDLVLIAEDVVVDVEFVCHRTLAEGENKQTNMNT